jgi:hypothetical protein
MFLSASTTHEIELYELVVVEIAIIDDSRIESLSIRADDFVYFLRDHASRAAILWIDYASTMSQPKLMSGRENEP